MKNRFFKLAVSATVLLLSVSSCKKDETQVVLSNPVSPQLTASATTATITPATGASPAVTYSWTKAEYGYQAAVTYTLQFAKAGTNFASVVERNVGGVLSKSFTVKELNDVYNEIDCSLPVQPTPPTAPIMLPLEVRLKANIGDAVPTAMSSVKTISAAPYPDFLPPPAWGLVGPAADGWPGATNTDRVLAYNCRTRFYSIRTALTPGAFLFRMDQAWATKLGGPAGDFSKGITLSTSGADLVWNGPAGIYNIKLEVNYSGPTTVSGGKLTVTQ